MTVDDFRRIALSFEGAVESSHMGTPDFRVNGRIFATLGSSAQGFGNLKLTPEQQAAFVAEMPDVFGGTRAKRVASAPPPGREFLLLSGGAGQRPLRFVPIPGGWGRMGMTHIRLANATEDVLTGALAAAWKLRVDKNASPKRRRVAGAYRRQPPRT